MVSMPFMLGLSIAIFGLGHALRLIRRHNGMLWPDEQLILMAVLAILAGGLIYIGLPTRLP